MRKNRKYVLYYWTFGILLAILMTLIFLGSAGPVKAEEDSEEAPVTSICKMVIEEVENAIKDAKLKYLQELNEEKINSKYQEVTYQPIDEETIVEEPVEEEIIYEEAVDEDYSYEEEYVEESYEESYTTYSPEYLRTMGVVYDGGFRYTWYSEKVLPGGGLNIPGRWSDGNFVRDGEGYICVASEDFAKGTVLETPWGTAKVYDCGCAHGTIDMYVSW